MANTLDGLRFQLESIAKVSSNNFTVFHAAPQRHGHACEVTRTGSGGHRQAFGLIIDPGCRQSPNIPMKCIACSIWQTHRQPKCVWRSVPKQIVYPATGQQPGARYVREWRAAGTVKQPRSRLESIELFHNPTCRLDAYTAARSRRPVPEQLPWSS